MTVRVPQLRRWSASSRRDGRPGRVGQPPLSRCCLCGTTRLPRGSCDRSPAETAGMLPTQVLDRFIERCPAVVMVRASLERLLRPERLDQIFEDAKQRQYTKQLLFSQVVAVMAAVATRTHSPVHAAY